MKPETSSKIQNAFLAAIAGAAIPVVIGFGGGFWVTKNTAEQMVSGTLLAERAKICVAQFAKAPDYQERLKQFASFDYSKKGAYIEKGGWGKMPGEENASATVIEACSRGLEGLQKK